MEQDYFDEIVDKINILIRKHPEIDFKEFKLRQGADRKLNHLYLAHVCTLFRTKVGDLCSLRLLTHYMHKLRRERHDRAGPLYCGDRCGEEEIFDKEYELLKEHYKYLHGAQIISVPEAGDPSSLSRRLLLHIGKARGLQVGKRMNREKLISIIGKIPHKDGGTCA
jgi:hypothetical protein